MLFLGTNLETFLCWKIVELFICSYLDLKVHKTTIKPSIAIFFIFANILASFPRLPGYDQFEEILIISYTCIVFLFCK